MVHLDRIHEEIRVLNIKGSTILRRYYWGCSRTVLNWRKKKRKKSDILIHISKP